MDISDASVEVWSDIVCSVSGLDTLCTLTSHSRAGTESRTPDPARPAGQKLHRPDTLSLSLSLSDISWLGLLMMMLVSSTCAGYCQLLVSLSASPVSDGLRSSLSVWVWLSEAGVRWREVGTSREWGNVRLIVRWWLAGPCLAVTVGCFRLRLQDGRRWHCLGEVSGHPENRRRTFSHIWCKAVTGDKTADSRLSDQCGDISNKTSLTSVATSINH